MTTNAELTVIDPGWMSTVQDLGRAGTERSGIPTGGAADQYSAVVGNILVGNDRHAPLLEVLAHRFVFRTSASALMAVTGASADVRVSGQPVPMWEPVCVPAGAEVSIAEVHDGLRNYVCLNGALNVETFLGSAAPDERMEFPQRLTAGTRIGLTTQYREFSHPFFGLPLFRLGVQVPDRRGAVWTIDVTDGPETGRITGIAELLRSSTYTVGDQSNHVGLRLSGPVLHPEDSTEILSHGVPVGGVEIPHSDELIILQRARVLTAGYPIVAIATRASLSLLGQARPGRQLRFRWRTLDEAVADHRALSRRVDALERRVRRTFEAVGLPCSSRPEDVLDLPYRGAHVRRYDRSRTAVSAV